MRQRREPASIHCSALALFLATTEKTMTEKSCGKRFVQRMNSSNSTGPNGRTTPLTCKRPTPCCVSVNGSFNQPLASHIERSTIMRSSSAWMRVSRWGSPKLTVFFSCSQNLTVRGGFTTGVRHYSGTSCEFGGPKEKKEWIGS